MSAYNRKIPLKTFRHDAVRATVYETPTPRCGVEFSVGFESGFRDDEFFDGIELMSIVMVAVRAAAYLEVVSNRRPAELMSEEEL
ncbi:MAG: hypothetical protein AAF532_07695 [Planctomycetota bacterium]